MQRFSIVIAIFPPYLPTVLVWVRDAQLALGGGNYHCLVHVPKPPPPSPHTPHAYTRKLPIRFTLQRDISY